MNSEKKSLVATYKQAWEKTRKPLLSVFIAFIVYGFWLMAWPTNPYFDPKVQFLKPVAEPFRFFGIYREFKLYAPTPPLKNFSIFFRISFDDGTGIDWVFPRQKLTPWDSPHSFDRYIQQYFFWEKVPIYHQIRTALARYVARQNNSQNKHPIRVEFISRVSLIPLPVAGTGKPSEQLPKDHQFFSYDVEPGDLL